MPGRRKKTLDIRTLILHMRSMSSDRAVQRATGMHRSTVRRYRAWAATRGLLAGPLPAQGELEKLVQQTLPETPPPQNTSSVEPYRAWVGQLRKEGVEMTAIRARLEEQGYKGSYSAVRRFVRTLEPVVPEVMVRVECKPGKAVSSCSTPDNSCPSRDRGRSRRSIPEKAPKCDEGWSIILQPVADRLSAAPSERVARQTCHLSGAVHISENRAKLCAMR